MDQIGKAIASAAIVLSFMFSTIFCFDSSDRMTDILLVGGNVMFWGALLWLINRKGGKK